MAIPFKLTMWLGPYRRATAAKCIQCVSASGSWIASCDIHKQSFEFSERPQNVPEPINSMVNSSPAGRSRQFPAMYASAAVTSCAPISLLTVAMSSIVGQAAVAVCAHDPRLSDSRPCCRQTRRTECNYLIDVEHAIIVDFEATPARTYDEVEATRTMIERTRQRFGLSPKQLAADTAYVPLTGGGSVRRRGTRLNVGRPLPAQLVILNAAIR